MAMNPPPPPPPPATSSVPLLCFEGKSDAWHLAVKYDNVTNYGAKHTL